MSNYQRIPQESYPPPGYGTPYPAPQGYSPPGYPTAPPQPPSYHAYPPPPPQPPAGYAAYPPQPPPQYQGYQGYFNDGYPPQPQYQCEHHHHHHHNDTGFLQGWYDSLLFCVVLHAFLGFWLSKQFLYCTPSVPFTCQWEIWYIFGIGIFICTCIVVFVSRYIDPTIQGCFNFS